MADSIVTFIDASVLIYAAVKPTAQTFARRMRALQVLNDPARQFVASEFLRLEVLPIARFFSRKREVKFYETFFDGVVDWAPNDKLVSSALEIASIYGLGALDALHVAAAEFFDAEFVSAERLTNRFTELRRISLRYIRTSKTLPSCKNESARPARERALSIAKAEDFIGSSPISGNRNRHLPLPQC